MLEQSSTPINGTSAVRLAGVSKSFGSVLALSEVSCAIARASLVAIVGANGSGKSTMLRVIAGVITPDSGSVSILGDDSPNDSTRTRHVGYAGQDLALDPEMTGVETLALFYALRGLPRTRRRSRIAAIVDAFELEGFSERAIAGYSGGQRQRLHLALETLHEPSLLLLDEPTASLDPDGRQSLWRRLAARRSAGDAAIVVTHDLGDVERYCDRVIILDRGRVVADDTTAAIVHAFGLTRTEITLASSQFDADELRALVHDSLSDNSAAVDIDDTILIVKRDSGHEGDENVIAALVANGIEYVRVERVDNCLASAFAELTGRRVDALESNISPRMAGGIRGGSGNGGGGGRRGAGRGIGGGRGGACGRERHPVNDDQESGCGYRNHRGRA